MEVSLHPLAVNNALNYSLIILLPKHTMSLLRDTMDVKKLVYTKPEKNGAYYYSPMAYDKNQPIHIQTPRMKLRVPGNKLIDKTTPMVDVETLTDDFKFYDLMVSIDERNIRETFKHNKEWFQKDIPLDLIDDMYKRTTKPVKKDGRPQFTYKVPMSKGVVQCPIFDQHQNRRELKDLPQDAEVILVVHIRGLKFLKQYYYCDMYVSQMKVFLPQTEKFAILNECMIHDDEPAEVLDEAVLLEIKQKREEIQKKVNEINSQIAGKNGEIEELTKTLRNLQTELSDFA